MLRLNALISAARSVIRTAFSTLFSAIRYECVHCKQITWSLTKGFIRTQPVFREREGGVGGSWRHIKEVLGSSGCRFVFIEGRLMLLSSLSSTTYFVRFIGLIHTAR